MALVGCATSGCPGRIRQGSRKPSILKDNRGRDLADGVRCWRCRQGITTQILRARNVK